MTALMFVVVVTISIIAYREFQEGLLAILDHRLKSDISAVQQLFASTESMEEIRREVRALLAPEDRHFSGGYHLWFDSGQTYLSSTKLAGGYVSIVESRRSPALGETKIFQFSDSEHTYSAIWTLLSDLNAPSKSEGPLNVLIYTSSDYVYHEIREFMVTLIILGGLIIWISTWMTSRFLSWGFKPVDQLTSLMDQVSGKHLGELSFQFPSVARELTPFIRSWEQMLERLSQSMRQQRRFTADASHELRTPLATIKSTLQVGLSQERSVDYYKRAMDQSLEDVDRLTELIEQLLELSRLDSVETYNSEQIDMAALVSDVCEHYKVVANLQKRRLEYSVVPAAVSGQALLLRRAISNLLDNALKYGPPASPITVRMERYEKSVIICIHDEGGAIDEQEQRLIFNRFYRVDKARTRGSGGAGIGLSIVKEVVQKHGGDISVSSQPERGTDFVLHLPVNPGLL